MRHCLARWNAALTQSLPAGRLAALTFVGVVATFLGYYTLRFGLDVPPSTSGDEIEYDSLGWELSQGRGFRFDVHDAEFRRPYDDAAQRDPTLWTLPDAPAGAVVHRPPLFPALASLINRLGGRQFWGLRLLNAAAMAGVAVLLALALRERVGVFPALVGAALFALLDTRSRLYGRAILTEALSALFVAALCWTLCRFDKQPTRVRLVWSAIWMGLAILVRTMFVFWLPVVALIVWRLGSSAEQGEPPRKRWRCAATFLLLAGLVVLPWAIRNCVVTGRFMPLGTQGQSQLPAGFGESAWETQGVWVNLEPRGFFDALELDGLSNVERHVAMAEYGQRRAVEWIADHPGETLALCVLKNWQELRPRTIPEAMLLVLAIAGIVALRRERMTWILLAVFAANAFSIAATWSVEGRFMVPLLFVQHVFAAVGAWWIVAGCPTPEATVGAMSTSRSEVDMSSSL